MCAGTNSTDVKESKMASGLISSHAYGFYDAKQFYDSQNELVRAVKIRNPWGEQELEGLCKVSNQMLMDELKIAYAITEDPDKGMVWIRYEDFFENFRDLTVCKVHDDFNYKFLRTQLYDWEGWGLALVTFQVQVPGLVYLSVHQRIQRHFKDDAEHDYSYVRLLLVRVSETGEVLEFIKGKFKAMQQLVIEKDLKVGKYVGFIEIDWVKPKNNKSVSIVVSTYSKHPLKVQNYKDGRHFELYQNIIKSYIRTKSHKINMTKFEGRFNGKSVEHNIIGHSFFKFGLQVRYYVSHETDITLDIKLTQYKPPTNMQLFYPKTEDGQMPYLRIKPCSEKILIIKTTPKPLNTKNSSFSYSSGGYNIESKFRYSVKYLKQATILYGEMKEWKNTKRYSVGFVGGIAYHVINNGEGKLTINIDTTSEGYCIDTSEMENVAPGQAYNRILTKNQEFFISYQVKELGKPNKSPPGLGYQICS